ncbi:hypothetical protein [Agrobacterium tumefaciens]|uniref:hypothetical protein n=1 Tax=Agrobacterium tumefaciens TaxID=358 RepID=UPI0021D1CEDB|nr:hypothetical protein [Agrobacterium tumefaciens]UXS01211.1 hypothetical protein FY156_06775 [Agrobacterium tumefaciens]
MLAPTLRTLRNISLAHLAGTYVTLLVFFMAGASVPDQVLKSPLIAWMMLPVIYPITLPLVVPFAVLSLFIINRYRLQARWTFTLAGAVSGLCSVLLIGYFMPGFWKEGPYILCISATVGGAVAGQIFKLATGSASRRRGRERFVADENFS